MRFVKLTLLGSVDYPAQDANPVWVNTDLIHQIEDWDGGTSIEIYNPATPEVQRYAVKEPADWIAHQCNWPDLPDRRSRGIDVSSQREESVDS